MIERVRGEARAGADLPLTALAAVGPVEAAGAAIAACGARERRARKLPALAVLFRCIAMHWSAADGLAAVVLRLARARRWAAPEPRAATVSRAAVCQARGRLGARPVGGLFRRVRRPLATPAPPGAFLLGLRLLALDTVALDVPDTAANDRAFGRPGASRGASARPQVQVAALEECGAHALCDAGGWPCAADPHAAARRLLRAVGPGVLLMHDRGLRSHGLAAAARGRGAHRLGRLPASVRPHVLRALADGAPLVHLRAPKGRGRDRPELVLRLIRCTVDDPRRPGHRAEHRLLTSLLDPAAAPAAALAAADRARGEIELAVDEIAPHRRPPTPLRSQKPVGVVQEVHGLLLAHYAVRAVTAEAAATAGLPPTRLSVPDAPRITRDVLPELLRAPAAARPRLDRHLLADVASCVLPSRADRTNPRAVKRKMSNVPVKRPHHRRPPRPSRPFRDSIVVLK